MSIAVANDTCTTPVIEHTCRKQLSSAAAPLRIMHVITRRELRGAEVVARDLCMEFKRRGHDVLLVGLFDPPNRDEADALTRGLEHADLGGRKRRGLSLKMPVALNRVMRRFRPDVVQANAFNALKFCATVKFATGADWPLVYRNVGLASRWVTYRGQRTWFRFLLRQVDAVFSVSDASRDDFTATFGYNGSRVLITRQGVRIPDLGGRDEMRQLLARLAGCPADVPLLVHVGNFAPEKNHAGLLDAFRMIQREAPDCRLVLIGDGPLRAEIERTVQSWDLEDRVRFVGNRSDAAGLVGGADVMLLSSHVEGIPGVVLEACAWAVPVVTTNVGGLSELIDHDVSGLLVPPGDMTALARETLRLVRDHAQRRHLGQNAREIVKRRHGMDACVDELIGVYRRLMTRRQFDGTTSESSLVD